MIVASSLMLWRTIGASVACRLQGALVAISSMDGQKSSTVAQCSGASKTRVELVGSAASGTAANGTKGRASTGASLTFEAGSASGTRGASTGELKPPGGSLSSANFAQKTYGAKFSKGGTFAGRSVDDVAADLRSGAMAPADVPIDYVVRSGNVLILNTRSAHALEAAGIPRSEWSAIDRTGQEDYEAMLSRQLDRNKLTSEGTAPLAERGHGEASSLVLVAVSIDVGGLRAITRR
jgi:hypothetical protein